MKKAVFAVVIATFAACAAGQSAAMKRYVNYNLGFELSYPANYRVTDLPCEFARWFARMGYQKLLYLSRGTGQSEGNIALILDRSHFSLARLETGYAHTGWEEPRQIQIGTHTFYFYGVGGGGVNYPDDYLYDVNGLILDIKFDGPYTSGSKSPTEETQQVEKKILKSFRVLAVKAPTEWHRH
ncbi:MAG TPA: hypothetical protein VFZ27_06730 [Terriglobia bacterium]|nr:hypothetical protein [Terriglobia bacterium]